MEKQYKLTLCLKTLVNDEIKGEAPGKNLEYTRQFMEKVKSGHDTLLEYYKYRAYSYLTEVFICKKLEDLIEGKDESNILLSVLPDLPTETATYILNVFNCRNGMDKETNERDLLLIYDQFGVLEITGFHFSEIGRDETKKR